MHAQHHHRRDRIPRESPVLVADVAHAHLLSGLARAAIDVIEHVGVADTLCAISLTLCGDDAVVRQVAPLRALGEVGRVAVLVPTADADAFRALAFGPCAAVRAPPLVLYCGPRTVVLRELTRLGSTRANASTAAHESPSTLAGYTCLRL